MVGRGRYGVADILALYRPPPATQSGTPTPAPTQGCTISCDWKAVQDKVPGCAYPTIRSIFNVSLWCGVCAVPSWAVVCSAALRCTALRSGLQPPESARQPRPRCPRGWAGLAPQKQRGPADRLREKNPASSVQAARPQPTSHAHLRSADASPCREHDVPLT